MPPAALTGGGRAEWVGQRASSFRVEVAVAIHFGQSRRRVLGTLTLMTDPVCAGAPAFLSDWQATSAAACGHIQDYRPLKDPGSFRTPNPQLVAWVWALSPLQPCIRCFCGLSGRVCFLLVGTGWSCLLGMFVGFFFPCVLFIPFSALTLAP